ncbi:MAG: TrkA family potassium uptake protein [Gammaproteobacteria bacterium]|nr:TrkA family potassium uptake protein [Gammaproteobacteria bacterium]
MKKDIEHRAFAVIGLGSFGSTVAVELARLGNRVIGIDCDELPVSQLADLLSDAVIADGRDERALKELDLGRYDAVLIAIGNDLEASIVSTMNVKMLGVEQIWVKAVSRTHHRILSKIGADRVVEPEREFGMHVAQMLHNPSVYDYVSLGNGFNVVNFEVPKQLDGRSLGELGLGGIDELRCLGLMRGSEYLPPERADTILREHDRLLLLGRRQALRQFSDKV